MMVAKGTKVTLERGHAIWIERTPDDIQALRDADAKANRFHDDGGEPILHGPYAYCQNWLPKNLEVITVHVTSLRPKWTGYGRRPKYIARGYAPVLDRYVIFKNTPAQ